MMRKLAWAAAAAALALAVWLGGARPGKPADGPGAPAPCAACHAEIAASFVQSDMSRSFARMSAEATRADFESRNVFRHEPSGLIYTMSRDGDGTFWMRRHRPVGSRAEADVLERRIDYVMGSGYKAQTFLSRASQNELVQLPVAWYAGEPGYWAMNPNYDRPGHDDFSRRVKYDCMFCHNAYPEFPGVLQVETDAEPALYPAALPEGIDCARCHGDGRAHTEALAAGETAERIRAGVVNPARLEPARRLEVCLQCHLQSTSASLPYSMHRPGRGVYSYRPGEPLGGYQIHFDHAAGPRRDGKFEIAHAGYRLLRSACFERSPAGALECTSCHDPHRPLERDPAAYASVCRSCHADIGRGPAEAHAEGAASCVGCHMPARRTDDVVHVVMTDHRIARRPPPGDPLAPKAEVHETPETVYRGEVALFYPRSIEGDAEAEILAALAQVRAGTNWEQGMPRLEALLAAGRPADPFYWFESAEALRKAGQPARALAYFEEALARDPRHLPTLRSYGLELARTGRLDAALDVLRRAGDDARSLANLGVVLLRAGHANEAVAAFRRSLALDPESHETHNGLGGALGEIGDLAGAEAAFREALRLKPNYAQARANLDMLEAAR